MSQSVQQHKKDAPGQLVCAVVTVSDTRTLENDTGGAEIARHLQTAGHQVVVREIIPDEPQRMRKLIEQLLDHAELDAILLTGGTGISGRDRTYETVRALLTQELPGYGELFRLLSYQEIGPAAMLSRSLGGLIGSKVLLTMPGSPAAVRLAMKKLIVPELAHLVGEARRHRGK